MEKVTDYIDSGFLPVSWTAVAEIKTIIKDLHREAVNVSLLTF